MVYNDPIHYNLLIGFIMEPDAQDFLDISRAAGTYMTFNGIPDTWANRALIYHGMMHAWRSEPVTSTMQVKYLIVLDQLIEEARRMMDAIEELTS